MIYHKRATRSHETAHLARCLKPPAKNTLGFPAKMLIDNSDAVKQCRRAEHLVRGAVANLGKKPSLAGALYDVTKGP